MDEISRSILRVFDELGRDTLDLHAMMEIAGGSDPARRNNIPGAVELLVRSGALEPAGGGDVYRRNEQARLAVAKPRDVTLYTRPKCRLCDEARAAILPILREFSASLREVNIDDDKELRKLYTDDVPVIFIGSREVARHQVDTVRFRKALEDAKV
ncbi:MAG TPA: glutaredoxin family protein [Candidatus Acidoferrales bacterium]|nr:glutaredoxin family protein [Candidatus Acidoferrales bacterium]